jgi:hypothetical protein
MQVSKFKATLMRLPGANGVFSKINAAVYATKIFIAGSDQIESPPSYETTKEYRAYQSEAERLKAKAEEYAQNLRLRFI